MVRPVSRIPFRAAFEAPVKMMDAVLELEFGLSNCTMAGKGQVFGREK